MSAASHMRGGLVSKLVAATSRLAASHLLSAGVVPHAYGDILGVASNIKDPGLGSRPLLDVLERSVRLEATGDIGGKVVHHLNGSRSSTFEFSCETL